MQDAPRTLQAISGVSDPDSVRIVVFINGELVHAPLSTVLELAEQDLSALVSGPASATDDSLAVFDGATGKIIKDGGVLVAALVTLTGAQTLANKTFTAPQINDASADHQYIVAASELAADRTITLPALAANDEFVFKAHNVQAEATWEAGTETTESLVSPAKVAAAIGSLAPTIPGAATAWVNFDGTGTVTIRDGYNIASVTRDSTGVFTVTFTTAMDNANYAVVVTGRRAAGGLIQAAISGAPTTTSFGLAFYNAGNSLEDPEIGSVAVFGGRA